MLKDERLSKIIELIDRHQTLKTDQIAEQLNISLATVRRDLNELDDAKQIKKIFGGAKSIAAVDYITTEEAMDTKLNTNRDEKLAIGAFAAQLIQANEFIYMDAGSSVEVMVQFIQAKNVTFVTNSFRIAKALSALNYKTFVLPGEIKLRTDAIIGIGASDYVHRFNFTKGFFGANGVHKEVGLTTPDLNEAMVKTNAIERCKEVFVLADHSKIGKVSPVTFCSDSDVKVITDQIQQDGSKQIIMKKLEEDL